MLLKLARVGVHHYPVQVILIAQQCKAISRDIRINMNYLFLFDSAFDSILLDMLERQLPMGDGGWPKPGTLQPLGTVDRANVVVKRRHT